MKMYELNLEPTELAADGRREFSLATCEAWRELLRRHGVADQTPDVEGYLLRFGPLWNRSFLYLDVDDVLNRTATAEAYITAYGDLRPEMLRIIREATSAANALLSRSPRSVREDTGSRARFSDDDADPEIVNLRTNNDLHKWMDKSVGRDVMSFLASKLFLALLWIFGALFTRHD